MNKWLILAGMLTVLASGCDSASVTRTTLESIAPENKATATYNVAGMTWAGCDTAVEQLLTKVAGIATANADKSTASAVIVYDKSIFDTASIGDEGRYKFSLKGEGDEDSAESGSGSADADSEEDGSMIKIEDASADSDNAVSEDITPSLDGPSS